MVVINNIEDVNVMTPIVLLMSPNHLDQNGMPISMQGNVNHFYLLLLIYTFLHILDNALHDNVMLKKE